MRKPIKTSEGVLTITTGMQNNYPYTEYIFDKLNGDEIVLHQGLGGNFLKVSGEVVLSGKGGVNKTHERMYARFVELTKIDPQEAEMWKLWSEGKGTYPGAGPIPSQN